MKSKRILWMLLLVAGVPLLVEPPEGTACGPFLPEARFQYENNPGPEFIRGQLGIVAPGYYRRNLVVAYRYLSGAPLAAAEIRALQPPPPATAPPPPRNLQFGGPDSAARWLEARNAVPGAQRLTQIEVYRQVKKDNYYAAYQNCLDDAFDKATATLAERSAHWGADSAQTAEWLHGQDEVFANCGERLTFGAQPPPVGHIPSELSADADPLLRADRQYQIAAASFYAGKYDDAERAFQAVAANGASPWSGSAAYLAARVLIRRGTVDGDTDSLTQAEKALQAILNDRNQTRWHKAAQGLLEFVQGRLYPEDRMVELGNALAKPGLDGGIAQAITDYTALWDRLHRGSPTRSDLSDWIITFQEHYGEHAVDRWRNGGSNLWLVAALSSANAGDSAAPELIAEARKLRPDAPAYATAVYHGIRLKIARGEAEDARKWAEEALAAPLPLDAQNAFRSERLSIARDWTEFLSYAARNAVAVQDDAPLDAAQKRPVFDHDVTEVLNQRVPLALWSDASSNRLLPAQLRTDIAQAGWVRAVMLDRTEEAVALARRTAALRPELSAALGAYTAEKSPEAARFAAVFLMLRTPGLQPVVRAGFGREARVDQLDDFRDNWWRLTGPQPGDYFGNYTAASQSPPAGAFLQEAQRAEGDRQWKDLVSNGVTGANYLCAQTLAWAQKHPDDPRVPEALHLAVRTTHYGPTDAATTSYSRQAFQLLHTRYPKSPWTAQTKYWY